MHPGEWNDFVAHIIWSGGESGRLQLWKNGKMVVDYTGPNEYSQQEYGPYFKIGIYHPQWKPIYPTKQADDTGITRAVTVYDDEVRFVSGIGSYESVAPKGDRPK